MKQSKAKSARRGARSAPPHGSAHVWIVEILHDDYKHKGWRPTVGCRLDKEGARTELKDWKRRNPCDRFRLTRYAPNEKLKHGGE